MIYEIATGKTISCGDLEYHDFQEIEDGRVKEILQYICSEELRDAGSQSEAVKKVIFLYILL